MAALCGVQNHPATHSYIYSKLSLKLPSLARLQEFGLHINRRRGIHFDAIGVCMHILTIAYQMLTALLPVTVQPFNLTFTAFDPENTKITPPGYAWWERRLG